MTIENLEAVKKTLNTPFHYITVGSNKNIILNLETETGEKMMFTGYSVNECIKEAVSYADQFATKEDAETKVDIVGDAPEGNDIIEVKPKKTTKK